MNQLTIGILIASAGYVVLAISTLFDKFLVTQTFRQPLAYAFWLGLLGLSAFVLLPFQFALPVGLDQWLVDLIAGAAFTLSIIFYMKGLYTSDSSTALPVVGSLSTIFTGLLAYLAIDERLTTQQIVAIAILLVGFWVLSSRSLGLSRRAVGNFVIAAIFFAIANVSMKIVLSTQPFIAGLAFSRLGAAAVSLGMLALPEVRQAIMASRRVLSAKNALLTVSGNGLGALGMIGVFFAYRYASPTILNAMQGVQYASLFVFGALVTKLWPEVVTERIDPRSINLKIAGIAVVILGLAMLVR